VDNPKQFYVGVDPASMPKDPKLQIQELKNAQRDADRQQELQMFIAELLEQRQLNQASMVKTQAEITHLYAQAANESDNQEIVRMQTALAAMKIRDESLRGRVDHLLKAMELESDPKRKRVDTGEVRRLAGAPDNGATQPASSPAAAGAEGPMV
jgi:hypothetical protein